MESMDNIDFIVIVLAAAYTAAYITWLLMQPEPPRPSRYEEVCEDIFRKAADLED